MVPYRNWLVAVLSTHDDLRHEREQVIRLLSEKGFDISAYEQPDFPKPPDQTSRAICLDALARADISLLIINKRAGLTLDGKYAITHEEYIASIQKNIPTYVFVEKNAWEEYKKYRQARLSASEGQTNIQFEYHYVDSVEVLELIYAIDQQEYGQPNNWISSYYGEQELLVKVEGTLKGLSRYYLQVIVENQVEQIKRRRTSTGFSMSLGDVLDKEYYVDPNYLYLSGQDSALGEISEKIAAHLKDKKSILVLGEAGYGKTTVLAKAFLAHAAKWLAHNTCSLPLYIWLKNQDVDGAFQIEDYLATCFHSINRTSYPLLDISDNDFVFYMDGFDEIAERITPPQLQNMCASTIFNSTILLTCREQYAHKYLNSCDLMDRFSYIIEIQKWDKSKALEYIHNFCSVNPENAKLEENIRGLLLDNKELVEVLDSPLLITMLLSIIKENRLQVPETIRTRVALFEKCLESMAGREKANHTEITAECGDILEYWAYFAWFLYENRLQHPAEQNMVKDILSKLGKYASDRCKSCGENLLHVIYDISGDTVSGAFHDQFLEYLVARVLCDACLKKVFPYPTFLQYVIRPEMNRYFRGIIREKDEAVKAKIVENIENQYYKNLGSDHFEAVATRVHAVYHLSRIETDERTALLEKIYALEQHISVRLSLLFGMVKLGYLDKEEEFYQELINNEQFSRANRGYHLAYYSDKLFDERYMPYMDDGSTPWDGTLNAILKHMRSKEKQHYFLRRIELRTMIQLIQARRCARPLSQEVMQELETEIVYTPNSVWKRDYAQFQEKIEAEFAALKALFQEV